MTNHSTQIDKIKLGGFPPIIFITENTKKIREFEKKTSNTKIDENIFNKLNILNIKNILGNK